MARPTGLRRLWIGSIVAALCATTCHMLAGHLYYGGMRQRVALASGGGSGGSDSVLGINVPSFSHFARAAKSGDYYQQRYRFGIHGHPRFIHLHMHTLPLSLSASFSSLACHRHSCRSCTEIPTQRDTYPFPLAHTRRSTIAPLTLSTAAQGAKEQGWRPSDSTPRAKDFPCSWFPL